MEVAKSTSYYLCRILCTFDSRLSKYHSLEKNLYCCDECKAFSLHYSYMYMCRTCLCSYCINHYVTHDHQTAYYFSSNFFIFCNPKNLKVKKIEVGITLTGMEESIRVKNYIYITGGNHSDAVIEYDIKNNTLKNKASMPSQRYYHALCTVANIIYSVGGTNNGFSSFRDFDEYNINCNKWKKLPLLNIERGAATAFAWKYCVYAIFGFTKDKNVNTMEKYTIGSSKWCYVPINNPLSPRNSVGHIITPHGIILMGGYNGSAQEYINYQGQAHAY